MKNNTILNLLQKLHRARHKPDLHSFKAKVKGGVVYVEAEEDAIFLDFFIYDAAGNVTREHWTDSIAAAAQKLEDRGIDLETLEI